MALSLSGGQSVTAGKPANIFALFIAWLDRVRTERARRVALSALLELDHARLNDLGISRQDVVEAMRRRGHAACQTLNTARACNARL